MRLHISTLAPLAGIALHAAAVAGQAERAGASQGKSEMNELKGDTGTQFDRAFIDLEVSSHEKSVQRWQQEANDTNGNATAAGFARLGLPIQQEHLALAQAIQAQLQNGTSATTR